MAHLFVLENSKRHILLYGQSLTAPLSSSCSVVYLLIQIHYISSTRSVGGNTFIKYLCLEHSERNDTYYEWIRIPDAIPSAFLFFDCPALPVFTTRAIRVPPKFPIHLSIHAMFYDPGRPSETLPIERFLCLDFRDVKHVVICSSSVSRPSMTGLNMLQEVRLPMACMVLCVHFT